ncbi:MAG: helix-turn-helix domain-containing protein [Clostridia bacterium]|nr:helix-turn-helix domain-containing protein [Clostridia bacterium]
MENTQYFLDQPESFHFFLNREEKDFFVHMIGYHNFHHIFPDPYSRKQPCFTLHFIVSGKGFLYVNGKMFTVYQHEVFFLDNRCTFAYYPSSDEPWEYVFFEFGGRFAQKYADLAGFSYAQPKKTCRHPQKVLSTLSSAFRHADKSLSYFKVNSLFFSVLDSVCEPETETEFFYERNFIEEVKHFIQLKYLTPEFNVEYLCNSMHISHSHLCRIFKQSENVSPIGYINNLKMARARELLTTTTASVRNVASTSGFREYEYFLRLFKRMHGVSPTTYRKEHQDCQDQT